jgi:DNA modification methylase
MSIDIKNKLICGDNLQELKVMDNESVDLIYIDPPFFTGRNYKNGIYEFKDKWAGGLTYYIDWLKQRVVELHRILKSTGSFYLHCDWHANTYIKIMLDKIFGEENFQNEIIWFYKTGGVAKDRFARKHDTIYFYTKSNKYTFNPQKEKSYLYHKYGFKNIEIKQDELGYYREVYCRDVWDISALRGIQLEKMGYPTQKPEALLERIIKASSNEGDVVLDAFCGSGTALVVAQKLNRYWIGIDISPSAITLAKKRLNL